VILMWVKWKSLRIKRYSIAIGTKHGEGGLFLNRLLQRIRLTAFFILLLSLVSSCYSGDVSPKLDQGSGSGRLSSENQSSDRGSPSKNFEGLWYRVDLGEARENQITVTSLSSDGFIVSAECVSLGRIGTLFPSEAVFIEENIAESYYSAMENEEPLARILFEFKDEFLYVSVETYTGDSETLSLGFGMNVTLSGKYSQTKPTYDYSEFILENVFENDSGVYHEVRDLLGEKDFAVFSSHFAMGEILTEDIDGKKAKIAFLSGIGATCVFYRAEKNLFYGYCDFEYFTNDKDAKSTPPASLKQRFEP